MSIAKGSLVEQVIVPIVGTVVAKRFNDDLDKFEYCVSYTGADGEPAERWFVDGEIQEKAQ
jgi:hypothetical protein